MKTKPSRHLLYLITIALIHTAQAQSWQTGTQSSINYTSGNVGIGTDSPTEKLYVNGNIVLPINKLLGWDVSNSKFIHNGSTIGAYSIGWCTDTWYPGAPTAILSGFGGLKFFTGNQPRFVIKNNGWIGVNHDNPIHPLDVAGNVAGSAFYFRNAWNAARLQGTGENPGVSQLMVSQFYALNSTVPAMFLDARSGKLGIGTDQPDAQLTVKGVIHTNEVRVDLSSAIQAPDYVFEKDYDLPSLEEIETYVNKNKHLPEVPSASDMYADGLNLKEMNLILLKKIEELILHMIRQQKEIELLKNRK